MQLYVNKKCSLFVIVTLMLLKFSTIIHSVRLNLVNNGYEEVHVGVDFSIPEKSSDVLIDAIKSVLNETSRALFIATNNRTYFRKVKIHVPSSWEAVTADETATITDYYDVDFLVTSNKNSDIRETFTIQSGGCGAPGDYIHVSQDFFTNEKVSSKGKVLVQEWAKYRWGVFDEHGYQGDPEYPLFYVDSRGEVQPNYCINSRLNGTIVYPDSNMTCINDPSTGKPFDSCRFMADDDSRSTVSSSLMSVSNIPSIEKFCDSSTHNSKLKNEHNDKCGGRSVWDVLDLHEDFLFNNNPPIFKIPDPQFRIAILTQPSYCIVIDDSSSMKRAHRSERVKKAVANWVNYEVKKGSKIAIVSFSNEAETLHPLTAVIDDDTKISIVNSIDLKSTGEISCLFCGLQRAINMLDGTMNSVIILITTDITTAPISMEFMNIKTSYENKVVSICLIDDQSYADKELFQEVIDMATNELFIITDDDIGNMLDDALRRSVLVQDLASKAVKIISERQELTMPRTINSGTFIIDSTLRNNLRVVIQTNDPKADSEFEFLIGPSGELSGILISKVENVVHFTVPYAEEGVWSWEIQYYSVMKDAMLSAEVFVDLVDPSVPPISAKHWALTEPLGNPLDTKVYLYSEVMQGDNPVIAASVNVKLTSAGHGVTLEKALLDERKDDGIYSIAIDRTEFPIYDHYVAQFTVESHSTTKILKRSINGKVKKATAIAFKRSEHLASSYLSDSKDKERNSKIQRFKRQFPFPKGQLTSSTQASTDSTTTNTESTTTNTGTTNSESTTTNTASTTTNPSSTTTNSVSTTTNTASTTMQPTTSTTVSTPLDTASTSTNTASTTPNTAMTTAGGTGTTGTGSTTTSTGSTTSGSDSTTISTGSTTTGTSSTTTGTSSTSTGTSSTSTGTGFTTTGTGSATTGTGSTAFSTDSTTTGIISTTTSTGSTITSTGSTTTSTGSTTTSTGSTTTGIGSTPTGTGSTTTGSGSTTTSPGSTTTGTGSTTTGTTSTTTGTGSTTTGTGSTTIGTGSTITGTGFTTTGTGSTTTGTGSTTTGTGSTTTNTVSTTTVTGSTTTGTSFTTTGTGSTTTGTGSITTSTGSTTTGTGSTTSVTGSTTTGTGSTTTGTGSTTTGTDSTTTGTGSTTTGTGSTTTGTGSTTTGTGSTTQSMSTSTITSIVAPTTSPLTLIGLKTDSDTVSPAAVTNVQATATSANTVQISWTATGDDSMTGKATAYQILLSTNQSDVQCQTPTSCSSNAIVLSYVNSVSSLAVIPTDGQPMNFTYTSPTPLQSNVTYYVSIIPLDDSGNFGALSNVSPFIYIAPQPFDYQQYFATTVWPVFYQILQYLFSALYDICFAVIVGSTAGVFALAGLAIYFGGLREGDLELGLKSGNQFPDDLAGLMNFKKPPQYNQAPQYNQPPQYNKAPPNDLSDIQGVRKIRGATPDDILFVWSPIQGFDFDGNILYDESHS